MTADCRLHRGSTARAAARMWLDPLRNYLLNAGVGQIAEVFDGNPPHRAGGCIAQAGSVGELLRAMDV